MVDRAFERMAMLLKRLFLIFVLISVPTASFFVTLWLIGGSPTAPELSKKAGQTEVSQWEMSGQATYITDSSGIVTMKGPNHIYQEFVCNGQCDAELSIHVIRADTANIGIIFLNAKREVLQNLGVPINNIENKTMSIKGNIAADARFAQLYVYAAGKTDTVSFKDPKLSVH